MEGAHGEALGLLADEVEDPLPHLPGGLVGEGDGHDAAGVDADYLHQVGDAVGDDARLAAAGPGEDEKGAVDGLDGFTLGGVEAFKEVLCGGHGLIIAMGEGCGRVGG